MRKIFTILILMLFTFPASSMAAPGGIFDGVIISSNTGAPISWATDGNKTTGHNIRNSPIPLYKFDEPTHISKVYIYGGAVVYFYSDVQRKKLIKSIGSSSLKQDAWTDVDIENVRAITAGNGGGSANVYLYELDFKAFEPIEYVPVNNIKSVATHNSIDISWVNPTEKEFRDVLIEGDGKEWLVDGTGKKIEGLDPNTEYEFEIYAVYSDGKKSVGQTVIVKTKDEPIGAGDINGLAAKAKHNRVDLSWDLPQSDNFKHVNIYREALKKSLLDGLFGVNKVKAATPIFETNGTYFNDLTVQSEAKYEYTLTTFSTEGIESEGVSVVVSTPGVPLPEIGGGGFEENEATGDYTFFWTEPTTGSVKVIVGGVLYRTVQASDLSIVIPGVDMRYTLFGNPDVRLVAVDENGNEGNPVNPPSAGGGGSGGFGELPFTVMELIKATFSFIKLIGPYVLLGLAIYIAPRIPEIIRMATLRRSIGGRGNDE